jgi:hypothetical protein
VVCKQRLSYLFRAVSMCSCAPIVAPACCVQLWRWSPKASMAKRLHAFVTFELGQVRDVQSQGFGSGRRSSPESLSPC